MGAYLSKIKNDSNDYEKILSDLDQTIQKSQLRIADIKIRQRRALALLVLYSSILWIVYLVYCISSLYNQNKGIRTITNATLPLVMFPFVIYYARRLLAWFYLRKQTTEESRLSVMIAQRDQKLNELKKKTSYYTTHSLLERYDPSEANNSQPPNRPLDQPHRPASLSTQQVQQSPPNPPNQPNPPTDLQRGHQTDAVGKQWFEKMFDTLAGKSEERYALVCNHCFSHNGLVLPRERDTIQYVCPQCHKFNPSKAMANGPNENNALSLGARPKHDVLIVEAAPPIELENIRGKTVADRVINRHYDITDESSSDSDDSK
ncbi:hypothetical protein CLU79DRAFT_62281 [Phycomyces nitens]|nr:hypothetical protein CLU79DRAFT_62281 [Phycomyces nitens]